MKLYDKVKVINKKRFCKKIDGIPIPSAFGHIGMIVGIDMETEYPYMVEFGRDLDQQINYFNEESLELVS